MFIFRGFIYLFAVAGVAQLISLEGYQFQTAAQYSEQTLTEHMQDFMSFFSCLLFLYAARLDKKLNIAATLLGALSAMMFVRESDSLLDQYVFDGAWQAIVSMIFVCVVIALWGRFSSIYASLKEYSQQPSFGTFLAGFVTIMAFSRLLGRGSFWQAVMGDSYMRLVKNIVEEGIETLGYTLILISAVELALACRRRQKSVRAAHS
ncbi:MULTISPECIES: hypothetical protein [Marinomonas]|uniref:Uncharacterized protein n=1 Tax=Marinomonas alcarazii TaxID=491949 RepID=A0A318VB60_9GAMM|nr:MULTISPECIES: hypothetical protein [Marinomonas]PYF83545.1 hypothetical protein DFP75_102643 [Marinomonas alcarazii]